MYVGKAQLGLIWYLEVFDLRIVAGFAYTFLSSSTECLALFDQLRRGDPEWRATLDSLPEVTADMPNLLVYLLSSRPCDIDGPLPLAGSETAERVKFTVDPDKDQLYGGSAFRKAKQVNAELRANGTTRMGLVLEKVKLAKEGDTAKSGGGVRVHGEHLVSAISLLFRV